MRKVVFYNTLQRQKVEFKPIKEGEVRFYSCGPTTYDFLHVGNARALVVGDLISRIFRHLGYKVTFVRNFTDVDDKIIKKAHEQGRDPIAHSALFVEECKRDMADLGMMPPEVTPKVTETIPEIIDLVAELVKKNKAYVTAEGEVLYHVPDFAEYGKLSRLDQEGLQHGKRVEVDKHKKHPADFVLWKPAKAGEPAWDSPWGKGRPGWHIECSAMAKKYLGDTIDLHHGGVDLIFPHHENEIAQSEAGNGVTFSAHWCHHEFVNFGSEKMSKSLGNVVTIREFIQKFGGPVLRQIFLGSHYRARLEWSNSLIEQAINDVERIHQFVLEFAQYKEKYQMNAAHIQNLAPESDERKVIRDILEEMKVALANDFNTATAMAQLFTLIRSVRRDYILQAKVIHPLLVADVEEILQFSQLALGAVWNEPEKVLQNLNEARKNLSTKKQDQEGSDSSLSDAEIKSLIEERKNAKKNKDFKRADEIRNQLKSLRISLLDHPDGTTSYKYE